MVPAWNGVVMGLEDINHRLHQAKKRWSWFFIALLLSVFCGVAYSITYKSTRLMDLWWDRDQQGQWYFSQKNYSAAARSFEDAQWQAMSLYASERFKLAQKYYQSKNDALGYFNLANSLAHQQHYDRAIVAYRKALIMQPDWHEAQFNLELVQVLAEKPVTDSEKDGGSKGDLGADDISFDAPDEKQVDNAVDDPVADGELGKDKIQQLWLRRLNTKPVEFLRRKFSYQVQLRARAQELDEAGVTNESSSAVSLQELKDD